MPVSMQEDIQLSEVTGDLECSDLLYKVFSLSIHIKIETIVKGLTLLINCKYRE